MTTSPRVAAPTARLSLLLLAALAVVLLAGPARAAGGIEDYPRYQPATGCSPKAKPGAVELSRWLQKKYGGGSVSISRACGGSTSEHTEGRAIDLSLDATDKGDRATAKALLDRLRATDKAGNTDALARRMGVMYVIWNDRIYSAWNSYDAEPYLNSACSSKKKCSATLRHRDHVHVSLTRKAARGETSWYRRH